MAPRFLQLADVAEVLNISSAQAYALVRSGEPAGDQGRRARPVAGGAERARGVHPADVLCRPASSWRFGSGPDDDLACRPRRAGSWTAGPRHLSGAWNLRTPFGT